MTKSIYLSVQFTFFICLTTFIQVDIYAQDCTDFTGYWMNQDSSILHIENETEGRLFGTYQSNASGDTTLVSWTGLVNRSGQIPALSFAISWEGYGSITSWTGYCSSKEDAPTITTMWHLVRPYSKYDWERFVTNQSTFTPFVR